MWPNAKLRTEVPDSKWCQFSRLNPYSCGSNAPQVHSTIWNISFHDYCCARGECIKKFWFDLGPIWVTQATVFLSKLETLCRDGKGCHAAERVLMRSFKFSRHRSIVLETILSHCTMGWLRSLMTPYHYVPRIRYGVITNDSVFATEQ